MRCVKTVPPSLNPKDWRHTMTNHRYRQILVPVNRYVGRMSPARKRLLAMVEGSLLLLLASSVMWYVH